MKAYLGLGSNKGDRTSNMREAVHRLSNIDHIIIGNISPVYETAPVGGPEQTDYLNAVIELETDLNAEELLNTCRGIEKDMGRIRKEHWGPRIIDIDVLFWGQIVFTSPSLTVPHPRIHERAFVLRPLADIAPDMVHPVFGLTVREMLEKVGETGIKKAVPLEFYSLK